MNRHTTPVVVGVAQVEQRPDDLSTVREPYRLMADAVGRALDDTGSAGATGAVSWIGVVQGAWRYRDPGALIASDLGLGPLSTAVTTMGGQAPQASLNTVFARIAEGMTGCAVVTGGETIWSRRRLRRAGSRLTTTAQDEGVQPDEILGRELAMSTDFETERGVDQPIVVYPLFESAIRAANGETIDQHRQRLGQLWLGFNQAAAANPHAWRRDRMTATEIVTPSAGNRMVGFPYTKAMNSNWDLDQASAIVACSAAEADRLGIPEERRVYPWVGAEADDTPSITNRRDLHSSPAITAIARAIFDHTGIGPDDLDHVDLYSCFPSAVQISADSFGLALDRPLTVTGGLTFAGGPLNNYVGHSVGSMVDVLRRDGGTGLVTANGGYVTKHSVCVYRSDPPPGPFVDLDARAEVDSGPAVAADPGFVGTATIEAYTVMHDATGPSHAVFALRTPRSGRTWGRSTDADVMARIMESEAVGLPADVGADGSTEPGSDR